VLCQLVSVKVMKPAFQAVLDVYLVCVPCTGETLFQEH
jgi:hypothetical protein